MSDKKLYARMNDCKQYSSDDWEAISHIKEITKETTISELIEWQKKIFGPQFKTNIKREHKFTQIFLSEGE